LRFLYWTGARRRTDRIVAA